MPDFDTLVIDASVAINLNATRRAADIIAASSYRFFVTPNVRTEVRDTGGRSRNDAVMLSRLIAGGLICLMELPNQSLEEYLHLVGGTASSTLDDGEAATIVLAKSIGGTVALDERKARALCTRSFPTLRLLSSIDLLLADNVRAALGPEDQAQAVYWALRDARMQVRAECILSVVDLIGTERINDCPSIPARFRTRR